MTRVEYTGELTNVLSNGDVEVLFPETLGKAVRDHFITTCDTALISNTHDGGLKIKSIYGKSEPKSVRNQGRDSIIIKSAGDSGNITITVRGEEELGQTLVVSTPNGLRGVPVESDGNYTDENGQQWICDEIDVERKKYIQRIEKISVADYEVHNHPKTGCFIIIEEYQEAGNIFMRNCGLADGLTITDDLGAIVSANIDNAFAISEYGHLFMIDSDMYEVDDIKKINFYLARKTPIETDIQIVANHLETYDGVTYIHTDSEVEPDIEVVYGANDLAAAHLKLQNEHDNLQRLYDDLSTKVQKGTTTINIPPATSSAITSPRATITFPKVYSEVPMILIDSDYRHYITINNITVAGFEIYGHCQGGEMSTIENVAVNWVAIK